MLSVGSLPPLGSGVIIGLRHPVPHSVPQPPQPQGRGVNRTVVAGDAPPLHAAHRDGPCPALVEEIVYPPLGGHPLPQHKPPVEGAAEAARVPLPHLGRQRRVILHGEVEVERPPLLRLQNPLLVKPVLRVLRVAGEPHPAPRHGAPGTGLLHEGAGHEGRLVQQNPRQRDALNQGRAALVSAAKEVEGVLLPAQPHCQPVLGCLLPPLEPQLPQRGQHLPQQIAPQRRDGFAAQPEGHAVEAGRGPLEEGQPHAQGLSAAYRSVANNRLPALPLGGTPPGEHTPLLPGKGPKPHRRSPAAPGKTPPPRPPGRRTAPPAAPARPPDPPASAPPRRFRCA